MNDLKHLIMERTPERDLWPGIEARLAPRRRWQPQRWMAAAACVMALLAGILGVERSGRLAAGDESASMITAAVSAQQVERGGMRGLVRAHLRMVEGSQREIRRALKAEPDADYLTRLLAASEQQRRALRRLLSQPV